MLEIDEYTKMNKNITLAYITLNWRWGLWSEVEKYPNILFFCFGEGKSVLSEVNKLFILIKYVITKKGIYDQKIPEGKIVKLSLSMLTPLGVENKQSFASDPFNKLILKCSNSDTIAPCSLFYCSPQLQCWPRHSNTCGRLVRMNPTR